MESVSGDALALTGCASANVSKTARKFPAQTPKRYQIHKNFLMIQSLPQDC